MTPPLARFVAVTFGWSWSLALLRPLLLRAGTGRAGELGVALAFMFGPMLGTWAARNAEGRAGLGLTGHFRPNRAWLAAWLLPLAYVLLTAGASAALPGVSWSPGVSGLLERAGAAATPEQLAEAERQLSRLPFPALFLLLGLQALGAGGTVNAAAALGEETGWRGYLYETLSGLGPWRASLVTGALWGAWHAPLVLQGHNYPQHPVAGVFLMVAWCTLLGPLLHHLRARTGSVVAVAVAHGTLNASGGLTWMLVRGGTDLTTGVTGLAGIAVAGLGVAVLAALRLRR